MAAAAPLEGGNAVVGPSALITAGVEHQNGAGLNGHALVMVAANEVTPDSVKRPTISFCKKAGAAAYSTATMGPLYLAINDALLPEGLGIMIPCTAAGTLSNIIFTTQWLWKKFEATAKAEHTKEVKSCRYSLASWAFFLMVTWPLAILACVGMYSAAFAGLKQTFPSLSIIPQLILSLIFLPGLLNEATFIAESAGEIPPEAVGFWRLAMSLNCRKRGSSLSLKDAGADESITAVLLLEDARGPVKPETKGSKNPNNYWLSAKMIGPLRVTLPVKSDAKNRVQALIKELEVIKPEEVTESMVAELRRLLTHPRYFLVAQSLSFIGAAVTSAVYCYNGAEVVGAGVKTGYNLVLDTGCNPETQCCEPSFIDTPWGVAACNASNALNFIFGVIYGWPGAMALMYSLPIRARNEPTVKNFLGMLIMYGLVILCCGNSVVQADLSQQNSSLNIAAKTALKLTSAANATFANAAPLIAITLCDGLASLLIALVVGIYNKALAPVGKGLYSVGVAIYRHDLAHAATMPGGGYERLVEASR